MRNFCLHVMHLIKQISKQNISAFSANAAFFIFLSLIPMLIMVCTIIPYTPLTEEYLLKVLTDITPDAFDTLIISIVSRIFYKSAGVLSVAALATVWSAGKGVLALIRGLNSINGVVEERNYFVLRLSASFYTVVIMIMLVLLLIVSVFGNVIVKLIISEFPDVSVIFDILMRFRFVFVWAVLTFFMALIYAYMPGKNRKFIYQIPGAAFSAIVWNVFSWMFAIYVDAYDSARAYGTLSIIILIMLWLYFGIYIVMIGAYLNRYFFPSYHVIYKRHKLKSRERRLEKNRKISHRK